MKIITELEAARLSSVFMEIMIGVAERTRKEGVRLGDDPEAQIAFADLVHRQMKEDISEVFKSTMLERAEQMTEQIMAKLKRQGLV